MLGEEALNDPLKSRARKMLAAAFIANERVGAIRLEAHRRKVIFGLFTHSELLVESRRGEIEWPSPSLEAFVARNAGRPSQLSDFMWRKDSVSRIVYDWMAHNSKNPWKSAIRRGKDQLVARGFLEKIKKRRFLIIRSHRLSIPPATLDVVLQAPVWLVSLMVSNFARTRPDLAQQLWKAVSKGVESRRKVGGEGVY